MNARNAPERTALLRSREDATDAQAYPGGKSKSRLTLAMLAAGLAMSAFTLSFDMAFVITNYSSRIASDLNRFGQAAWIILCGSVSETTAQPLYSHLSQVHGRQSPAVIAAVVCLLGLLCCSISHTLMTLSLSRILVGLGSSGVSFLTILLINDQVGVTELPLWRSGILVTRAVAEIAGGPAGSALASKYGWQSTFAAESVLIGSSTLMVGGGTYFSRKFNVLKSMRSVRQKGAFDVLGTCSLVLAVAVPLGAISAGGDLLPWAHPAEITLLCLTPILVGIFWFIETHVAEDPILSLHYIGACPIIKILLTACSIVFAFNTVLSNLSLYVDIRAVPSSPMRSLALSFVFGGQPLGAIVSGILIRQFKFFKILLVANTAASAILYAMLAAAWFKPEMPAHCVLLVMLGFLMGVSESCLLVALFSTVQKSDQSALYATFGVIVAFAANTAIATAAMLMRYLFGHSMYKALGHSSATDKIIKKSLESLDHIQDFGPHTRQVIISSLSAAIRSSYGLASLMLILGLFTATKLEDNLNLVVGGVHESESARQEGDEE